MAPKFGTSGLRGLVTELTAEFIADHVRAFCAACDTGTGVFVGHDLRPSSPRIAEDVTRAARAAGMSVTRCGPVPTPALALAATEAGAGAIMITGSHIPADRNGLKFYTASGEITKADEAAISASLTRLAEVEIGPPPRDKDDVAAAYTQRYLDAFGPDALAGLRLGIYAHSTVIRDIMAQTLTGLGAECVELGRSDDFIPVDTEAVDSETRQRLSDWASQNGLDSIISADGDGDRPLLTDADGNVVPGDVLGQITAASLGADCIVTPVSSNTGAEASGRFSQVIRTRIGSPHVIAAMKEIPGKPVVGYEANGGLLLGFDADGPAGTIGALLTRDSLLPIIATLTASKSIGVAARVAAEPARFTAADRLSEVPTERAQAFLTAMGHADERAAFLAPLGVTEAALDQTDGLRISLRGGSILHLRASGNAPEFRVYTEAGDQIEANTLLKAALAAVRDAVNKDAP